MDHIHLTIQACKNIIRTPGKYVLLWESAATRAYTYLGKHEYRNLNAYWNYQTTPQIKLYNMDKKMATQQIEFKSEYTTISLEGGGQSDGDIIAITNGGCHIRYIQGSQYIRINENLPQIWFGSKKGVTLNTSTTAVTTRMSICWVPSAVLKFKEIDEMYPLYNFYAPDNRAQYELSQIYNGANLPEIYMINPPPENSILLENTEIKFGTIGKIRPLSGGKVVINEVLFTEPDHISTTENSIITINFDSTYCSSTSKNIKYLYWGDYYSLKGLPTNLFKAGTTYKFIIYSNSFICCGDAICSSNILFGSRATQTPVFQYTFKYQDFSASNSQYEIDMGKNSITIESDTLQKIPIAGANGYVENLYFIGLIMNLTNCGVNLTYTHPTQYSYEISKIEIKGIDFSSCPMQTDIIAHIKFFKVLTTSGSARWASSQYYNISIGKFGCHSDCLTCNGPTSNDCLTCNVSNNHKYLVGGKCLSSCTLLEPYILEDYNIYDNIVEAYKCVSQCPSGFFATMYPYAQCLACNSLCKSCTSNEVMSCTSCNNYNTTVIINGTKHNIIVSPFLFNGMCQPNCPYSGTVLTTLQNKTCIYIDEVIDSLPSIKIEVLGSKQKVNKKKGAKLRAVINNENDNLGIIKWSAYPPEEESSLSKSTDCDSCYFYSYAGMYLYQQSVKINESAFNRTASELPIKVMVKAYNKINNKFTFDMVELFPDYPPPIDNIKDISFSVISPAVTINQKFTIIPTCIPFDLQINDASDTSEWPISYLKVVFEGVAYYNNTILSTTPSDFYILPIFTKTLSTYRKVKSGELQYTITNITIPPLITSTIIISNRTITGMRGRLRVYAENEYFSISEASMDVVAVEHYNPEEKEKNIIELSQSSIGNWDDALLVANKIKSIGSPLKTNATGMKLCYSTLECSGNGVCVNSICQCEEMYYGQNCQWKNEELQYMSKIVKHMLEFMAINLVDKVDFIMDQRMVDAVCSSIIGTLNNPEPIDESYISTYLSISDKLLSIDSKFVQLLSNDQVTLIINALSKIAECILTKYKLRFLNAQASLYSPWNTTQYVEENSIREKFLTDFSHIKDNLYSMLDKIALSVFSTDIGYTFNTQLFCAFVTSDSFENLITKSIKNNEDLALKCPYSKGFAILPLNMWDKVSGHAEKREIKFRFLEWRENPYMHSIHFQYTDSSVLSIAIYDVTGTPLPLNDNAGIIYVLPRPVSTQGIDMLKHPRCMRMTSEQPTIITKSKKAFINVNSLQLSDKEKKELYPQWDKNIYAKADLVVEETQYYNESIKKMEFGVNQYDYLIPPDYANDKAYFCQVGGFSEVAVVFSAVPEIRKHEKGLIISTDFSLIDSWYTTIGFIAIVVTSSVCIAFTIVMAVLDKKALPKLELEMEDRRMKIAEKKILNDADKKKKKGDKSLKKKSEQTNDKTNDSHTDVQDISSSKQVEEDQVAEIEEVGKKKKKKKSGNDSKNDISNASKAELKENTTNTKNDMSISTESKITTTLEFLEKKVKFTEDDVNEANIIFSPEYQRKKVEKAVSFKTSLLNGYLAYNSIAISSITLSRATRAILFTMQIICNMFWIAVLISLSNPPLNQPDEEVKVYPFSTSKAWVPFLAPLLTEFLMYMYAGITFVSGFRVVQSKNILTMRNQLIDLKKEKIVRLAMAYSIIGTALLAKGWFIVNFSATYGWEQSSNWLWCFFISMALQYGVYDVIVALIQQGIYKTNPRAGTNLYNIRSIKWATTQE